MKLLETHDQFEQRWGYNATDATIPRPDGLRSSDNRWIVYFTAKWCGPCKQINVAAVDEAATAAGLTLWKCDIDANEYTTGYCGVRAVPTFICFEPKKVVSTFKSNQTEDIVQWIRG